MDHIAAAFRLLESAATLAPAQRWQLPFPLGVYGTLRTAQPNHRFLQAGNIAHHCKAFLPDFRARGLWLEYCPGAAAPLEVFCYEPAEWAKMIPDVDDLEGFAPGPPSPRATGYYRTLAWLHLLPDDFTHAWFTPGYSLRTTRDLQLAEAVWQDYPRVPGWVYSNRQANQQAAHRIIWG